LGVTAFCVHFLERKDDMGHATENQLVYACVIADKLGIDRPANDFVECMRFISKYRPLFLQVVREENKKERERNKYTSENDIFGYRTFSEHFGKTLTEVVSEDLNALYGVYCFLEDDDIIYIGKSYNLGERILSSFRERIAQAPINRVMYRSFETKADTNIMELLLIAENKPRLNMDCNVDDLPMLFDSKIDILEDFNDIQELIEWEGEDE
jgi:hypothetical protein